IPELPAWCVHRIHVGRHIISQIKHGGDATICAELMRRRVEIAALTHASFPEGTVHRPHLRINSHRLEHWDDELEHIDKNGARLVKLKDDRQTPALLIQTKIICVAL